MAASHLFPHHARPVPASLDKMVDIVAETESGEERVRVADRGGMDPSLRELERTADRQAAVLGQVMRRYGLTQDFVAHAPNLHLHPTHPLNWRTISLTQLRMALLTLFASRDHTIPFASHPSNNTTPTRSISVENLVGLVPPPRGSTAAAAQNAAGSPYTPLMHVIVPSESASPVTRHIAGLQRAGSLTDVKNEGGRMPVVQREVAGARKESRLAEF